MSDFPFVFAAPLTGRSEPVVEQAKLIGTWRYETDEQAATSAFRADGTFTAELKRGEGVRKFEETWSIEWSQEENVIVSKFTGGSSVATIVGTDHRDGGPVSISTALTRHRNL